MSAIFVSDCREASQNGQIDYTKVRDIFFDHLEEDPQTKAQIQTMIQNDQIDDLGHLFVDSFKVIEKQLNSAGLQVINK